LVAAATADSDAKFAGGNREFGGESESVGAVAAFFAPVTSDGSVASMLGLSGEAAAESAPLEYASKGVVSPVLLLDGMADGLVPHAMNSVAMFDALQAVGEFEVALAEAEKVWGERGWRRGLVPGAKPPVSPFRAERGEVAARHI
jgi:hypothetical protein